MKNSCTTVVTFILIALSAQTLVAETVAYPNEKPLFTVDVPEVPDVAAKKAAKAERLRAQRTGNPRR